MQVTLHQRFLTEAEAKSLALATTLKKPPFFTVESRLAQRPAGTSAVLRPGL